MEFINVISIINIIIILFLLLLLLLFLALERAHLNRISIRTQSYYIHSHIKLCLHLNLKANVMKCTDILLAIFWGKSSLYSKKHLYFCILFLWGIHCSPMHGDLLRSIVLPRI